jgi:nitrogen-specific signal transduction histidine kinase
MAKISNQSKLSSSPSVGSQARKMNVTGASQNHRFQAFDWLATPIAVLESNGTVVFVNSELEDVMGQSRRSLEGESFLNFF